MRWRSLCLQAVASSDDFRRVRASFIAYGCRLAYVCRVQYVIEWLKRPWVIT